MKDFFNRAAMQNHPLRVLQDFLDAEAANERAKKYDDLHFVGYVLDITYNAVTIITSDPFKVAVGGIPRNSLLIMTPSVPDSFLTPHFTLLRVLDAAPTPLSRETQQTFFELQKKSMPELDIFTQSELQWGALKTEVLGMFYPKPDEQDAVEFSGDMNNFVSAHKYRVYSPTDELLNLVVNSLVPSSNRFFIGKLRMTECRLPLPNKSQPNVDVCVSTDDFMATRTAMFGKTRLGKSNIVKLIAQSLIITTEQTKNVGQLIFDINGEYANDNPQDGNKSLKSIYDKRCHVYSLTPKKATPSSPLKLNFYEQPQDSQKIIASLLEQDGWTSGYIRSYTSVELISPDEINRIPPGSDKVRSIRKLQMFWAILKKAGFQADESQLFRIAPSCNHIAKFNPGFRDELREAMYSAENIFQTPGSPNNLGDLQRELEVVNRFRRNNNNSPLIKSKNGDPLFDPDDIALLEFLEPLPGRSGPSLLQSYRNYHDPKAGDFVREILVILDNGDTVILDLGNAHPVLMTYFSDLLSREVFSHQVDKFSNDQLGDHYIELYFEEAHNLFPRHEDTQNTIYSRFAKEGAKYHIGMVYSTQSPSTISGDLLAQTENFFILHMSSLDEVNLLARLNVAFNNIQDDILRSKTRGYARMLTRSHRFVVPMQAKDFRETVK